MFHTEKYEVRNLLLSGKFGLEKESLRVNGDGFLSHTSHPFPEDKNIVMDFCENQTEINTSAVDSAGEAVAQLRKYHQKITDCLQKLPEPEYLWPFSNPPYIRNEQDIPIAQYSGEDEEKTRYREYLASRYGRYKMTFSGIHVNYSFDEALLKADFSYSGENDFISYKNRLYLSLAEQVVAYGWLMVAVTAASPLMDSSFVEKGRFGGDVFNGMGSVRCSEMGYWNFFTPVIRYEDVERYVESIEYYVREKWIRYPSELYYPVRLKPAGSNTVKNLREHGINHIELRMFDLNPFAPGGVDERDVIFAQLFLVWLASTPHRRLSESDQIQAVQNFKNAAHYDLKTVNVLLPDGTLNSVATAALQVLEQMQEFYGDFPESIRENLEYQKRKFEDQENRYSWKVREKFDRGFVKKGMDYIKRI